MNKCIFLDRDGVLNEERGEYTFLLNDFIIPQDLPATLKKLKELGYLLIVITNQAGISRGVYTKEDMFACHRKLQESCASMIDDMFYCPYYPEQTNSLARKPQTLMFERAVARYDVDVTSSWMIGDSERDMIPAKALGLKTAYLGNKEKDIEADMHINVISEFINRIV